MRRMRFSIGALLAMFAIPGFAAPAQACRYSRPIFTARLPGSLATTQVRVRVSEALTIGGRLTAVRATVVIGSGRVRRGDRIVIVLPRSDTGDCYYGGLADAGTVGVDGVLEGYVTLGTMRPSGAFPAWLSEETDWSRYDDFAQGRRRGQWVRPRFTASGESSE
jgi:hypothetical protein